MNKYKYSSRQLWLCYDHMLKFHTNQPTRAGSWQQWTCISNTLCISLQL